MDLKHVITPGFRASVRKSTNGTGKRLLSFSAAISPHSDMRAILVPSGSLPWTLNEAQASHLPNPVLKALMCDNSTGKPQNSTLKNKQLSRVSKWCSHFFNNIHGTRTSCVLDYTIPVCPSLWECTVRKTLKKMVVIILKVIQPSSITYPEAVHRVSCSLCHNAIM